MKRRRLIALPVAIATLLAVCGGQTATPTATAAPVGSASAAPSATPTPVAISIGYASLSGTQAAAWVAKERGIYAKNGLDVTLQSIAGGSSPTGALLSDNIQGLQISVEAVSATLEGGDIVYVAAPLSSPLFWFVVGSGINSAADLKGKTVAMTTIGSATYFADVLALQKLGLDPKKDVSLISVNNVPAILSAIQSGQVAAGALSMPTYSQAKKLGMKSLVNVAELGFQYPSSWLAVRRSYVAAHRGEVAAMVKSTTEAIAFELQNPKETMDIIGKYTQTTDQALLQETYDTLVPYLNRTPLPKPEQVAAALTLLEVTTPKAKGADPKQFVDTTFVEELQKTGFIDTLYKK